MELHNHTSLPSASAPTVGSTTTTGTTSDPNPNIPEFPGNHVGKPAISPLASITLTPQPSPSSTDSLLPLNMLQPTKPSAIASSTFMREESSHVRPLPEEMGRPEGAEFEGLGSGARLGPSPSSLADGASDTLVPVEGTLASQSHVLSIITEGDEAVSDGNVCDADPPQLPPMSASWDSSGSLLDFPETLSDSSLTTRALDLPVADSDSDEFTKSTVAEYDWAIFISSYASGRWDPNRPPKRPRFRVNPASRTSASQSRSSTPTSSRSESVSSIVSSSTAPVSISSTSSSLGSTTEQTNVRAISISGEQSPSFPARSDVPILGAQSFGSVEATQSDPSLPLLGQSSSSTNILANTAGFSSTSESTASTTSIPATSPGTGGISGPGRDRPNAARLNRTGPGHLALPAARLRASWDLRSAAQSPQPPYALAHANSHSHGPSSPALAADQMASAAAIRWAGSQVSLAPLVLPSPERELTDPFHGVTTTIPGSHPSAEKNPALYTPGGTRLSRFWQGTQEVDDEEYQYSQNPSLTHVSNLELDVDTAHATPTDNVDTPSSSQSTPTPRGLRPRTSIAHSPIITQSSGPPVHPHRRRSSLPISSAPLPAPLSDENSDDYFAANDLYRSRSPHTAHPSSSSSGTSSVTRWSGEPPGESEPSTVPAAPRRSNLSRQTSAPLPVYNHSLRAKDSARRDSQQRLSRAAKEEQMFTELGYLVPPMAPDELERRRALYKFNIWNTGPDPNFDRIVHLVKLVFATKAVGISLQDGYIEWFKAQSGMKDSYWMRSISLSAHAILQRGDEPLVVLNASKDWRFEANPLVTGAPHVRFWAAAPIRTTDGYSIGTLIILDDQPRSEFSPRQRHTLKEFAAVAMREFELWRDKIQLRIRDRIQSSMEQFTRECLEINDGLDTAGAKGAKAELANMERIYTRAARLVKKTLDVEDAFVLDVSHSEVLETISAEGTVTIARHGADGDERPRSLTLTAEGLGPLNEFFLKWPDGRISETVVPPCLRPFMPTSIQYALTVPILNVDKRPFALICAYNASEQTMRYLEGHELSYLRAIGVIILSAVLKRRMILADKAKGLFISNISHELRTPLHGILAAAELLADTPLTPSQTSFLQTVRACGTSLVETVNHVLDFTKLSGNTRSGGVDGTIGRSRVDMMQLIEEAVEGCWIGHKARMSAIESDIGSVYAPPPPGSSGASDAGIQNHVETVVDIGRRAGGWVVKCEKGGIRRVLMNILGNSLKFTTNGYIHVSLRELEPAEDEASNPDEVMLELSVLDTGKGISQDFLKNQLFHPFSQENPLQTGTGLGLAIVNSIVRSSSVNGSIDVSSAEGVGTEIRISFTAERVAPAPDDGKASDMEPFQLVDFTAPPKVALYGFDLDRRGDEVMQGVICAGIVSWGLQVSTDTQDPHKGDHAADIILVNEDSSMVVQATEARDPRRPFIILTSHRGSTELTHIIAEYERIGGFARIVYKPGGPSRLRAALKLCLHALNMTQRSRTTSMISGILPAPSSASSTEDGTAHTIATRPILGTIADAANAGLSRRHSEDKAKSVLSKRPLLGPRAMTTEANVPQWRSSSYSVPEEEEDGSDLHDSEDFSASVNQDDDENDRTPISTETSASPSSYYSFDSTTSSASTFTSTSATPTTATTGVATPTYSKYSSPTPTSTATSASTSGASSYSTAPTTPEETLMPSEPGSEAVTVVPLSGGGSVLKASITNSLRQHTIRVLIVEDNAILRNLLVKWLKTKNYHYQTAVDGQDGVDVFERAGPFDVVLLDVSMPVLDGIGATEKIRAIESTRRAALKSEDAAPQLPARILALTGMSSLDDKRRAFEAGVDGYLVKPVAFKTLNEMFHQLGLS